MGVTLEYTTKSAVTAEQFSGIVAAARTPDEQPWLLCEPIWFHPDLDEADRLSGSSKLNLMPDPLEAAEAAAEFHAEKNDLEFLIDRLEEFSRQFGVDWAISVEGETLGSINDGVCDPQVREAIDAMAEVARGLGDLELDEFM